MTPLAPDEVTTALNGLPGWKHERDALTRSYEFPTFRIAIIYMLRVSFIAEEMNHHPEWTNVYTKLKVRLTTHDAGSRVTEQDVHLAKKMQALFNLT
jgi:4a-hydroxytetrahydrobiopterin dehydratase